MTKGYSIDNRSGLDLTGKGREVAISDGIMTYTYDLHDGETIEDAIAEFCDTYDFDPDGPPLTIWVSAQEYLDGQETANSAERKLTVRP